ncbi:hypothetical protein LIER_25073 [Lithospermum erythrorhizon]|uniref:Reverse transcriptase domain-containing protein n=1 Tax=Lithospermum erythrorhizon TaxID=34254 RepID=A0AAV3R742_LITER
MLIKSKEAADHEANLRESFDNLRKYNLRLNPDKCVFGETFGKFLGYMISQRGIEPNPEKIEALQAMQSPRTQKEAQRLKGRIAALTRFISRVGDRSLPSFMAIEKGRDFEWTPECKKSFQELKAYLQSPKLLAQPVAGDVLQLYLVVSESALKSVLIREEAKVHRLVYYVSWVMRGAEIKYPLMEKMVYAVIFAVQKLKPYLEAHPVERTGKDLPVANKIQRQSLSYTLLDGFLYRSGRPPEETWRQEVYHCGGRLLHQVGRGQTIHLVGSGTGGSVPEGDPHPVRGTLGVDHR